MRAIHIEDLTVAYEENPVLWDIDLDIYKGNITAIVGPNGAGKSTLLKAILDFVKPLSGRISIFDSSLKKNLDKIAYVPQRSNVNWDFPIKVFDVVLMGRYKEIGWFKKPSKIDKDIAFNALKEMGLEKYIDRQINELSGGQKQRVFIARALCQNAELLIMDEPLAGVDQYSEKIIMNKMKELQKQGKTIVCVHHDLNTLKDYFDRVVLINRYLVAHDTTENILNSNHLTKAYQEVGFDETAA